MNTEFKHLISLVRNSDDEVEDIVRKYFADTQWSMLVDEWQRLSDEDRRAVINRLRMERRNGKA